MTSSSTVPVRRILDVNVHVNELKVWQTVHLDGIELVDSWSEVVGVSPEGDLQQRKELVHAGKQRLRPERKIKKRSYV